MAVVSSMDQISVVLDQDDVLSDGVVVVTQTVVASMAIVAGGDGSGGSGLSTYGFAS